MTFYPLALYGPEARSLGRALTHSAARCGAVLAALSSPRAARRERARERQLLLAMDDRALRDIGISRCDASLGVPRQLWRP